MIFYSSWVPTFIQSDGEQLLGRCRPASALCWQHGWSCRLLGPPSPNSTPGAQAFGSVEHLQCFVFLLCLWVDSPAFVCLCQIPRKSSGLFYLASASAPSLALRYAALVPARTALLLSPLSGFKPTVKAGSPSPLPESSQKDRNDKHFPSWFAVLGLFFACFDEEKRNKCSTNWVQERSKTVVQNPVSVASFAALVN